MTPDLDAALAAVRAHEPAITLGNPGVVERGDEIWIYLEHPPRSSIADGRDSHDVHRTDARGHSHTPHACSLPARCEW